MAAGAPLTDVGVYLGWFGAATGLVHHVSALAAPLERLPGVRGALDQQGRRIQRSRAGPGAGEVAGARFSKQAKTTRSASCWPAPNGPLAHVSR
jgi:hypothetical protein